MARIDMRPIGEKGSVAVVVALSLMVLVLIVGGVIDVSRAIYARETLQQAADAGALAAAKNVPVVTDPQNVKEEKLAATAQELINANLGTSNGLLTVQPVTATYSPGLGTAADTVKISLSATAPTAFLKLVGINDFEFVIESTSQMPQPGPIDLALVLDTTKSMSAAPATGGATKIETLKVAATDLVKQLMTASNPNIRVGVVPYSHLVNVGLQDPAPSWVLPIERDYCAAYTYENPNAKCTTKRVDCLVDGVWTDDGCSVQNDDCKDRGKTICTSTARSPWNGCVGARSVITNNPANIFANTFTEAYLDNISDPTVVKYSGQSVTSFGPNAWCPSRVLPLSASRDSVLNTISGLKAAGDTHIPLGLIWGWNILAPGEPYDARTKDDLAKIGGFKVLLLMTDGINATSPRLYDGALLANGYGNITPPWRDGTKSNELTTTICDKIKGESIRIYTVLFDVTDTTIRTILEGCASKIDGKKTSFNADNSKELRDAFAEIGNQLMEVKLLE